MSIATVAPHRNAGDGRFDVGDRVVHPHHGAGEVVSRRRRRLLGSMRDYLEIEFAHTSLRIMVPCESAAAVGLRAVVGRRRVRRIVEVLESAPDAENCSWSQRQKRYRAKLKGGDVLDLAAVIRDLAVRAAGAQLPTSERELYERSRQVLASELCYALDIDAERARAYIDESIASSAAARSLASEQKAPAHTAAAEQP
jgi:CarD family transcriptional regulator